MYTSVAGALVAEANVDLIANNLANVNTGGFKRSLLQAGTTSSMELYRIQTDPGQTATSPVPGVPTSTPIGQLGFGSAVLDTPTDFEQGALESTGNPLDLALQGDGMFAIQTPQGVRYTRNGNFTLNTQGILTTTDGNLVLGQNGAITIPPTGKVVVSPQGAITIQQAGGVTRPVDQLRIVQFSDSYNLRPQGANLFQDYGALPSPDTTTTVSQGMLEKSNADPIRAMVDLITNQRWFEANEKSIQTQDTATQQVIDNVGKTA